jgi:hypothetical protein
MKLLLEAIRTMFTNGTFVEIWRWQVCWWVGKEALRSSAASYALGTVALEPNNTSSVTGNGGIPMNR